jgi:LysR family transcriptional activator of mexEF-oprN operon
MIDMREIDDDPFDLNLLKLFVLLMEERSVTRAARRLSLGQPAVSHALGRLRAGLGDPLFVRQGRAMEPTPRAFALLLELRPAMERIEAAMRASTPFDPATAQTVFRIGMSDDVQLAFLPAIINALQKRIPNASLIVHPADYIRADGLLDRGEVTTVVSYLEKLPSSARVTTLRTVRYEIVCGGQADVVETLEQYIGRCHAVVTFARDLTGYVDETLEAMGVARSVVLSLPQFSSLPNILNQSDLIASVPDFLAHVFAADGHLKVAPLPFPSPTFDLSMAWRAVANDDPAEKLLREVVSRVIRQKTQPIER